MLHPTLLISDLIIIRIKAVFTVLDGSLNNSKFNSFHKKHNGSILSQIEGRTSAYITRKTIIMFLNSVG